MPDENKPDKPELEEPKRELSSTQPGWKGGEGPQPDVGGETTTPASGLSVGDLQNIAMIIDLCTRRGSFKAEELATVGGVYNKLKAFLDSLPKPEGDPAPTPQKPATEMPANAPAPEGGNN